MAGAGPHKEPKQLNAVGAKRNRNIWLKPEPQVAETFGWSWSHKEPKLWLKPEPQRAEAFGWSLPQEAEILTGAGAPRRQSCWLELEPEHKE